MTARTSRGALVASAALSFALAFVGCAESPPLVSPPPAPPRAIVPSPALERAVRACTYATSVAGSTVRREERALDACVDRLVAIAAEPEGRCLLAAESFAEVSGCLGRPMGESDAARLCESHPAERSFCLGRALVLCDETPRLVDCGKDSRCTEARVATGIVVRACADDCRSAPDLPPVTCRGSDIVRCAPGLPAERTTCPLGTRCIETRGEGGEPDATCERTPCVPGRARCDGARLESCVTDEAGHGSAVVTDCASFGLACASQGTRAACVTPEPYGCERGATFCEGDALRACPAGVPVRVRCAAYGLAPCRIASDGVAACGPPVPRPGNVR